MNERELIRKAAMESFLDLSPIEWEKKVDELSGSQKDELRRYLEGISERAAMLAGYLEERHGYGCGDHGHKNAVKRANRNGKMVWVKVFGYNGFIDITI